MNKKILLTFCLLVTVTFFAKAQSWQWAISGGSSDESVTTGTGNEEDVYDMATDARGNVYVLATVQQNGANVAGHTIPTWGDRDNVVLTSFKCDGTYRWSKVFGNNSGGGQPVSLKTDPLGGVYVAMGVINYNAIHLDTDTTIPYAAHYRQLLLIKYDTAGTFKWYKWPEPDTITYAGASAYFHRTFDMSTDSLGNVSVLAVLSPGAYGGGAYVISAPGETMHLLKYSSTGAFISGTPMAIGVTGYPPLALKMKRNARNGNMIVTGQQNGISGGGTLSFGSTLLLSNMFVGCFNNAGALLWVRQGIPADISYGDAAFNGVDLDAAGDIYLAGKIRQHDSFNTYVADNAFSTIPYGTPIIVKMDTSGNNLWVHNAYEDIAETWASSVAVSGNEVGLLGAYGGKFTWPGFPDTLEDPINTQLYNMFIARFNTATGSMLSLDTVASPVLENEFPAAIVSDPYGNYYEGGSFEGLMYFSNGDTLISIGGETDFFVSKYGAANCDCTLPVAGFTNTTGSPSVSFTYTGTTGTDSVQWNFGDGTTSAATNPVHTYSAAGTYTVCVAAFTACGSNTTCSTITIEEAGVNTVAFAKILVYPNPADEQLIIENATEGTSVRLYNIVGQQVYIGTISTEKQVVDIRSLPEGNYLMQLTDTAGNRIIKTVVKK